MHCDVGVDTDDMYWLGKTPWYESCLDSSNVAAILDVQETTVRQYAARATPGFPVPAARESGRNYWTPDQIFRYIDRERPQLANRMPRLYSTQTSIVPAKFLFGEPVRLVRPSESPLEQTTAEFALHHWQPADGRGIIAIAYPGPIDELRWGDADLLLQQRPTVSAVALVTHEISIPYDHDGWQAAIGVAERGQPPLRQLRITQQSTNVAEWGWYTLANLLRVDLPWWSPLLRDVTAMASWFPGAPRQQIRPRSAVLDQSHLMGLVPRVPAPDAAKVRELAVGFYRQLEGPEIEVLPPQEHQQRPGLLQAAEPLHQLAEIPPDPDVNTVRWLLHRPISDPDIAMQAARALDAVRGIERVVANVINVNSNGQLAQEWLTHRVPVDGNAATELGFAFARRSADSSLPITGYFTHAHDPNVWIVQTFDDETGTHQYHVTVGQQVPASGHLTEVELYNYSGFFRDSNNQIWPIPILLHRCYYNSGYGGSGPQDLFEAITALRGDAGSDLTQLQTKAEPGGPLWNYIRGQKLPLIIGPDKLSELMPTTVGKT
ncbi:hypothetical protein MML61_27565 (plasmid) [Mycobacterium marinum]|uniref:hypothetical protein n=2 Tax=Mycobacterium marinum TaxID=1781 RepID=UPI000AD40C6B|nr:hypothetical protein [Mycobacterium marinum]WCS21173.1 hypothetical protein MML61_27565 [Mycobacterium marinum]GJO56170.1 hypothetical protein NJB1604_47900 [Mycobacterium marinum]